MRQSDIACVCVLVLNVVSCMWCLAVLRSASCNGVLARPIQSNSSAIEPNRTPIVRLLNSIEHNRIHNKILPIEHNRTIGNRTQSNVRLTDAARSSLNSTRTVCAMANSASVIVRHAQQSSDDAAQLAHGINFAGRDSKINTRRYGASVHFGVVRRCKCRGIVRNQIW